MRKRSPRLKRVEGGNPQHRPSETGLMWLGSIAPVTAEILRGIEYAQERGWQVRIRVNEPPGHSVAFYVRTPIGAHVPIDWARTVDEMGRLKP